MSRNDNDSGFEVSERAERIRAAEARRRAWHDEAAMHAAEPKVTCIAKITTITSVGLYRFGKIVAGQPVQVPYGLIGTMVANGMVDPPDPAAVLAAATGH